MPKRKLPSSPDDRPAKDELRKRLFAALYVGTCRLNGTDAARQAGYTGAAGTLASRASRLLEDPFVKQLLVAHAEAAEVTEREVMGVLGRHMRSTMADFINFDEEDQPHLDLNRARQAKQLAQLKKFKERRNTVTAGDELVSETVTYEIELYDAQAAAEKLGRVLGMFVERFEQVNELPQGDMTDEEWLEFYVSNRVPREVWIPGIRRLYEAGRLAPPAKTVQSKVLPGG